MKRSGFRRPVYERKPPSAPAPLVRASRPAVIDDEVAPVPKAEYVRSERLREAYRRIPCQHCGAMDGTVCCAHANWGQYGKGKGIKASDDRGASLCHACHTELDQGRRLSRAERVEFWERAHVRSARLLVELGHWPADIPVPDLTHIEEA